MKNEMELNNSGEASSILVIDDDNRIRTMLVRMLEPYAVVYCASDVDEGLCLFRKENPRLVFTDFEMPGKNGIEGIQAMRSLKPHVNIVMLTGSATRELIEEAKKVGACECLSKPFDMNRIHALMRRYMEMEPGTAERIPAA